MLHSNESEFPSLQSVRLIEEALSTLKDSVSFHIDCESRIERLLTGWQQQWQSHYEQLRLRIEQLEAQLAPWADERGETPRLAVIRLPDDAN